MTPPDNNALGDAYTLNEFQATVTVGSPSKLALEQTVTAPSNVHLTITGGGTTVYVPDRIGCRPVRIAERVGVHCGSTL